VVVSEPDFASNLAMKDAKVQEAKYKAKGKSKGQAKQKKSLAGKALPYQPGGERKVTKADKSKGKAKHKGLETNALPLQPGGERKRTQADYEEKMKDTAAKRTNINSKGYCCQADKEALQARTEHHAGGGKVKMATTKPIEKVEKEEV